MKLINTSAKSSVPCSSSSKKGGVSRLQSLLSPQNLMNRPLRFGRLCAAVMASVPMLLLALPGVALADSLTYDAAADFNEQNPNGVWSYGYGSVGGDFTASPDYGVSGAFAHRGGGTTSDGWRGLHKNLTAQAQPRHTGLVFAPHALVMHPGNSANPLSKIRFTAPTAGCYDVDVTWTNIDQQAKKTRPMLYTNAVGGFAELFAQDMVGYAATASFAEMIALDAGEILSFELGNGGDGFDDDSVDIELSITEASCPIVYDAAADFNPGAPSQDELVFTDGTCSQGFDLITPNEARERTAELCDMLGTWYIVRLANGGSMGGSGYGCTVFDNDTRGMGASLCTSNDGNGNNGWSYLYDADGSGAYSEMSIGVDFWGGTNQWRDPSCTEAVLSAQYGVVLAHPSGCGGWTALAWEAPANGVANIHVAAGENPGGGGSGVDLELRDDAGTLLFSQYDTELGVTYEYNDVTPVVAGERVYLRVAYGPGGTWCDTTVLDFDVIFTPNN